MAVEERLLLFGCLEIARRSAMQEHLARVVNSLARRRELGQADIVVWPGAGKEAAHAAEADRARAWGSTAT